MKKTRTFTIEEYLLEEFDKIAKQKSLNKSLFVENCIKTWIKNNKNKNDIKQRS